MHISVRIELYIHCAFIHCVVIPKMCHILFTSSFIVYWLHLRILIPQLFSIISYCSPQDLVSQLFAAVSQSNYCGCTVVHHIFGCTSKKPGCYDSREAKIFQIYSIFGVRVVLGGCSWLTDWSLRRACRDNAVFSRIKHFCCLVNL